MLPALERSLRVLCLCAYFPVAALVLGNFVLNSRLNRDPYFEEIIEGTATRPAVTRVLTPMAIRGVAKTFPKTLRDRMVGWASTENPRMTDPNQKVSLRHVFVAFNAFPSLAPEFFASLLVLYGSLLGFCFALRSLTASLFPENPWLADSAPLFASYGLLPLWSYGYLFDFPTLALMTLGYACLFRKQTVAYLAVFLLASLNRETSVLLIPLSALLLWREQPVRVRGAWVAGQLAVLAVIRFTTNRIYRDNLGHSASDGDWSAMANLLENRLLSWTDRLSFPEVVSTLAVLALMLAFWNEKPLLLRRAMLWVFVPLLASSYLAGWAGEWRQFYEAYPLIALMVLSTLWRLPQLNAGWETARAFHPGEAPGIARTHPSSIPPVPATDHPETDRR